MKNTYLSSLFCCCFLFFLSCQKESALGVVPEKFHKIEKVATMGGLNQMLNNASGVLKISNLKPFGPSKLLSGGGPSEIYASFSAETSTSRETFGAIELQDLVINPGAYDYYKSDSEDRAIVQSYFGKMQTVKVYASKGATDKLLLHESIYLPKELFVSSPIERERNRITPSTSLQWNSDTQNSNGIFILIDFVPDNEENSGKYNLSFASHRKLIYTEDDGIHQFQLDDFNQIPSGAYVSFFIGRGDYLEAVGSNDKSYILYSLTGAVADFFVDKPKK